MPEQNILITEEQVNDLVEHFYNKLIMLPYYRNMFAERGVDLDQLKERQRHFIKRLVNPVPLDHHSGEVHQVQHRHQFDTTPERVRTWLDTMEESIKEMNFSTHIEEILIKKMRYLTDKMLTKGLTNSSNS